MTSVVAATAFAATNVSAESPKYTGDYSIEDMINKYNVITLGQEELHEKIPDYTYTEATGNVRNFSHIIGPMLVEGEIGKVGTQNYEALTAIQRVFGVSPYVKGRMRAYVNDFSSQDGTKPILYFGSANEDLYAYPDWASEGNMPTWWYGNQYSSSLSYFSNHSFEIVDDYVDFNKLYTSIKEQQSKLKKGTVVTPEYVDYSGGRNAIKITYGEYYTIESLDGVDAIIFYGFDKNADNTTVINLLDAGDDTKSISMPELLIYENNSYNQFVINALPEMDPTTGKITAEERIRNIIWNIPNAEYISFDLNSAFVGHIIAPQADVDFLDTNYGGCMVANSIISTGAPSQIYFHPYGDAELETETQLRVSIEKRADSVSGNYLAGAKLQLLDETGNVVEEWVSGREPYAITASLVAGKTYTIHETEAPEGYLISEDMKITIQDTEDIQVFTMVDTLEPTEIVVNVEKRSESLTGTFLAGAKLQLLDKDGNVIEEWTTTEEAYVVKADLVIGETYTIHEVEAPEGYELAKDVTITVEDTEEVQIVTMVDSKKVVEEEIPTIVSPDTGDNIVGFIIAGVVALIALIAGVIVVIKMKNKKQA